MNSGDAPIQGDLPHPDEYEDIVHIRGHARCDEDELKGKFGFPEMFSEIFFRKVELPGHVDSARATAEFDDDVLEMTPAEIKKPARSRFLSSVITVSGRKWNNSGHHNGNTDCDCGSRKPYTQLYATVSTSQTCFSHFKSP